MLNKHNLSIAALCDKTPSRFALSAIQVTSRETVETDGHQLIRVTVPPEMKAENFPVIPNMEPVTDEYKPFLLPAEAALAIAKYLPKKPAVPIISCAGVSAETDKGEFAVVGTTDLEFSRPFRARKPAGAFPDYTRVLPKIESAGFRIQFDANVLSPVLKQIVSFCDNKKSAAHCILSFSDPDSSVRIDAKNSEGQELTAVVMPLRMKEVGFQIPLLLSAVDIYIRRRYCNNEETLAKHIPLLEALHECRKLAEGIETERSTNEKETK